MERHVGTAHAQRELAKVERELRKIVQAIKDGVSARSIKVELANVEARQTELKRRLEEPEAPPLLHPSMSDLYREKVTDLCSALQGNEPSHVRGPRKDPRADRRNPA
jgi:hypothetical protein